MIVIEEWLEGTVNEETVQGNIMEELEGGDDSNDYDMTVFDRMSTDGKCFDDIQCYYYVY